MVKDVRRPIRKNRRAAIWVVADRGNGMDLFQEMRHKHFSFHADRRMRTQQSDRRQHVLALAERRINCVDVLPFGIREFLTYIQVEKGLSTNTLLSYTRDIAKLNAWAERNSKPIEALDRKDLREWIARMSRDGLA